jgi:choline dehydrogenase-like flavoprotein
LLPLDLSPDRGFGDAHDVITTRLHERDISLAAGERGIIVIVGAGTVGLHLAVQLEQKGYRVIVIESGNAALGSFEAESCRLAGRPYLGAKTGRSRCIGGTSNLWGGQLVTFQPIDFRERPWVAPPAWPITYDEIAPYFSQTYEQLGVPPDALSDEAVWKTHLGATPLFSDDVELFLTRWMKTPSMSVMHAEAVHSNPRLVVLASHSVVGFLANGERLTGVVVRDSSNEKKDIPCDTIVIAAGTIETVRLLLAAQADRSWPCPWQANRMLGMRFQDHLGGRVGALTPLDKQRLFRVFSTLYWNGHKFQPKLRVTEEACVAGHLLGAQGIVCFESSAAEHLVYLKQFLKAAIYSRRLSGIRDFFRHAMACARHLPPLMWTYMKEHRMFVPFDSQVVLNVQAEQQPYDGSRITVDPQRRDAYGLPQAVIDWQITGEELPTILDLAQRCGRALEAAGLATLAIEPDLLAQNPSFLDSLHDTYHAAGGAIMGGDEEHGVVDSDLRVFGTTNLYIASAATFPTSSSANVTFTALAFATRLADHLQ